MWIIRYSLSVRVMVFIGSWAAHAAHPNIPIHIYPAGHGFSCDERGSYHEPSASTARERSLEFFRTHVG